MKLNNKQLGMLWSSVWNVRVLDKTPAHHSTLLASGATEEDSKHERLYWLDKPVKILPEQKHGFYIYGNSASAVCFSCSDRTGGNSDLENEDLVAHTGCAMNAGGGRRRGTTDSTSWQEAWNTSSATHR